MRRKNQFRQRREGKKRTWQIVNGKAHGRGKKKEEVVDTVVRKSASETKRGRKTLEEVDDSVNRIT